MQLFTVKETCEICGTNAQTLRNWVTHRLIIPARPGTTGKGKGHGFSIVQVLALAAGARWCQEGADPQRVAGVVRFLAGLTLERLEADLKAGKTFPVPAAQLGLEWRIPGLLIDPSTFTFTGDPEMTPGVVALLDSLNLKDIYADVKRKAAELAHSPTDKRGRSRGLAGRATSRQ